MFRRLDASAFAFVMATAIVSVACFVQRLPLVSDALFALAATAAIVLAVASGVRVVEIPRRRPRLESFAIVAAIDVLGARFALAGQSLVAVALWTVAIAAWLTLLARRPVTTRASGGWFLIIVGTESLAVLASLLAHVLGDGALFVALVCWLAGLALYPGVAAAIAAAVRQEPRFDPDFWIAMGALAIATLAGIELLDAARAPQTLRDLHSVLRDTDVATWALASAWIIPLVTAELRARSHWRYEPSRWSFVFPLGMYSVATAALSRALGLGALADLARAFFVLALIAWMLTFAGFLRAVLLGSLAKRRYG